MADDCVKNFTPPVKKARYDDDTAQPATESGAEKSEKSAIEDSVHSKEPGAALERKGVEQIIEEEEEKRQIMNSGGAPVGCNFSNEYEDENDEDEDEDDASDVSEFSGLSGDDWKPTAGPMAWIQRQALLGADPRELLKEFLPSNAVIPEGLDQLDLWQLLVQLMSEPPKRKKLPQFNTLNDAVQLIKNAKNIIVLTGAGISVSCGIPDFRSRDGIYARLAVDFPDLPDPQSMFDISYFKRDQRPFFKFAKEIYPGQFNPSLGHMFIKELENHGKLLRNFTQNIDTIELTAGIERVIQCHGSFASATCMRCKASYSCEDVRADIFSQIVPQCMKCSNDVEEDEDQTSPSHQLFVRSSNAESTSTAAEPNESGVKAGCSTSENPSDLPADQSSTITDEPTTCASSVSSNAASSSVHSEAAPVTSSRTSVYRQPPSNVIKPDIVFFGESLPELFHQRMAKDKDVCDLLIVIGSSLKVRPVALIPSSISPQIPQILINRESLRHMDFDIELLGDCDVICNELLVRLGDEWTTHCKRKEQIQVLPLDDVIEKGLREDEERKLQDQKAPHPDVDDVESEGRGNVEGKSKPASSLTAEDPSTIGEVFDAKAMWKKAFDKVLKFLGRRHRTEPSISSQTTKMSIAKYLEPHQSVFLPPSTHIFSGAEVAYKIKVNSRDGGGGGGDDSMTSDDSSSESEQEEGEKLSEQEHEKVLDSELCNSATAANENASIVSAAETTDLAISTTSLKNTLGDREKAVEDDVEGDLSSEEQQT